MHALRNAHLLYELQAVTDSTPEGSWCWTDQAAQALRALNKAADDAIYAGQSCPDSAILAEHTRLLRSAALIGPR